MIYVCTHTHTQQISRNALERGENQNSVREIKFLIEAQNILQRETPSFMI